MWLPIVRRAPGARVEPRGQRAAVLVLSPHGALPTGADAREC
jgi:hypothetical protein